MGAKPSLTRVTRFFWLLGSVLCFLGLALTLAACGQARPQNELSRLLGYLPRLPATATLPEATLSFSDLSTLKKACGYSQDIAENLVPVAERPAFRACVDPASLCPSLAAYREAGHPQIDIGYDVTAIHRCVEGGGVLFLEGNFDSQRVATRLQQWGYEASSYRGTATYSLNAASYTGSAEERALAEPLGHVAVVRGGVYLALSEQRLQAALDAWDRRGGNLAGEAQYAALAKALGPTVNAVLALRGGRLVALGYQEDITRREVYYAKPAAPCDGPDAPAYSWQSRQEITRERTLIVAFTAASVAEATAEGERLAAALWAHPAAAAWTKMEGPAVGDSTAPTVAKVTVWLKEEVSGGLPAGLGSLWP